MKKITLILALTALMLSSCFLPNNYELDIVVHEDGSYDFSYQGELNFLPTMDAVSKGEFTEQRQNELQDVIASIKGRRGYESVEDLGKGKIKVNMKIENPADSNYYFYDKDVKLFFVENWDSGELHVEGFELDKDSREGLKAFDLKLEGKLTVEVPKSLKVTENNADKKKKAGKKATVYTWKLDLNSEKPKITIKP